MTLNDYFIPGFGISRLVIQRDIKFHLGPQTIVRPYTYHVCKSRPLYDHDFGFADICKGSRRIPDFYAGRGSHKGTTVNMDPELFLTYEDRHNSRISRRRPNALKSSRQPRFKYKKLKAIVPLSTRPFEYFKPEVVVNQ